MGGVSALVGKQPQALSGPVLLGCPCGALGSVQGSTRSQFKAAGRASGLVDKLFRNCNRKACLDALVGL